MILVDSRIGSKDLRRPLRARGLDAHLGKIEHGDVEFCGQLEGKTRTVGVEIKTLTDLLGCLASKRYVAGQLPGMLEDYSDVYLIVEGVMREATDGVLEVASVFTGRNRNCMIANFRAWGSQRGRRNAWKRAMMATDLLSYLTSVEGAGVRIRMTLDRAGTVACLTSLYKWWQKPKHNTLRAFYSGDKALSARKLSKRSPLIHVSRPTQQQEFYAGIPGVSWVRSQAVAQAFPLPRDLTAASLSDFLALPGFGKVLANRVYEFLHGRVQRRGKVRK